MNILITGASGFVGSHLIEYLLEKEPDSKIYGLCRWRSPKDNLVNVINKITLVEGDLLSLSSLITQVNKIKPDIIFHLAAQSYVLSSFLSPEQTLMTNIIGTANLLEAVRNMEEWMMTKILIVSSSEVYGEVLKENQPTTEHAPLKPASIYAVSKVGADMLGFQYHLSYNMHIIRTRAFSHSGPRRGDRFVLSSFAKQLAAISLGLRKENKLYVGNLESARTFCDVKDMVAAYYLAVTKGDSGQVYNIGGSIEYPIKDLLNELLKLSGLKGCIDIVVDPRLYRPSDVVSQRPDSTKFRNKTGWKPVHSIDNMLKDIYRYWLDELKRNPVKL